MIPMKYIWKITKKKKKKKEVDTQSTDSDRFFDSEVIDIFLDFSHCYASEVFHFALALIFSWFQKTLNDLSRQRY